MTRARALWIATCAPALLAAQDATGSRWAVRLDGPAGQVHGDLRFEPGAARLLLESSDSAWWSLHALDTLGTAFGFRAEGWRFAGTRQGDAVSGEATDPAGGMHRFRAERLARGIARWPVRPRVAVRQLVVGSPDTVAHFPAAWLAARPDEATLEAEYQSLLGALGWVVPPPGARAAHAEALALGFLPEGRAAAAALLAAIARSPAADAEFRRLFVNREGTFRLDLHDAAWEAARLRHPALATDPAPLAAALRRLGHLGAGQDGDPRALVRAGWQAWVQAARDPEGHAPRRAALPPPERVPLEALLAGYDDTRGWWTAAVRWLVEAPWIATPAGPRSPATLLADHWGGEIGALPRLVPTAFGAAQAVPVLGATRLTPWLLAPRNAIAAEWLTTPAGAVEALVAWRQFDTRERLEVALPDGTAVPVTAPAAVMRSRYGSFLEADDAIRIEPGIVPLFAVATVVHEWLHVLVERARLAGDPPPGFTVHPWGLRLREPDPWLGEGIAEWGTDAALAPAAAVTPLFALLEAAKRRGLAERAPDDPHVLGYALVRALAARHGALGAVRDALVASLHAPAAVARAAGLDGPPGPALARPATRALLPEYVFTVDAGVADAVVRRLLPPDRLEDP